MRVLGVDPGLSSTGYGAIEARGRSLRLLAAGRIRSGPGEPLARRLLRIHDGLREVLERWRPECVAVEGVFHARHAAAALLLGHVRGAVLVAAGASALPVAEYTPREVKQAVVGTGRAEKRQVQMMVRILLRLPSVPRPADLADALAVAICHANRLGSRITAARPEP